MITFILIGLILLNFVLLTRGIFNVPTGMMLTALVALSLVGADEALPILRNSFADFSLIAVLFTAVAVPAHILDRSSALEWVGLRLGEVIGGLVQKGFNQTFVITALCFLMTFVMAALFHNTTSILVTATIITIICRSYRTPVIPVLSGALIASNLGGFSTRWGDTPNIVEAHTWGLGYGVFFREILPVNLGVLALLVLFTVGVVVYVMKRNKIHAISRGELAYSIVKFRSVRRNLMINKRLMTIGIVGLATAVLGPLFFPRYEVILSGLAIVLSVVLDEREHRNDSMFVLGIGTYASLLSIFIIAKIMGESSIGIGEQIRSLITSTDASILSVTLASYVGTLMTEAASWATAASPIIVDIDASTTAAWALGAGICAGSSSLITAATAGIILLNETKDNPEEERMTFGKYWVFGLVFSGIMLVYYNLVLPLI